MFVTIHQLTEPDHSRLQSTSTRSQKRHDAMSRLGPFHEGYLAALLSQTTAVPTSDAAVPCSPPPTPHPKQISYFKLRAAHDTAAHGKDRIAPHDSQLVARHKTAARKRWSPRLAALAAP
jgi:hypothetical protein